MPSTCVTCAYDVMLCTAVFSRSIKAYHTNDMKERRERDVHVAKARTGPVPVMTRVPRPIVFIPMHRILKRSTTATGASLSAASGAASACRRAGAPRR